MKATTIVMLSALGATTAAHADSSVASTLILECGASVQDIGPQDKDVSVEKSVTLVNGQWSVVHRVLSGHVYNRASQYEIKDTTSLRGLPQWRGMRISNPALAMVGEVTAGAGAGMTYQEWLYKNGRLIMHTASPCQWSRGSQPLRIASAPSQIAPAYTPPLSAPALAPDNNSPMHPMTFRDAGNGGNCNSCEWLVGDGEITADTPRDFERFMADKGYSSLLYLNSPGGNLGAGIELGQEIRAHGLSTAVAVSVSNGSGWEERTVRGLCASACAYAFLGGVSRTAKAGELGVHQFSGKFDLSSSQEVSGTLVSYVAKMGVDPRLVSIASSASPEDVHFLTAQELAVFKITVDDDAFGPWEIKSFGSGVVAISETPDHGKKVMLLCARDAAPRLVIADKVFGDGKNLEDAVSGLTGVDALGLRLPGRNANVVKGDGGAPLLEISLTGLDLRKTFSAQDLGVDVANYAPHAVWGWLGYTFNTQNASESFRVAVRNCV